PGRLERDRRAVAQQRDGAAVLVDLFPAEAGQSAQQGLDPALAVERRRAQVVEAETELLVLGADAPIRLRLFAGGDVGDELVATGDRRVGGVAGAGQGRACSGGVGDTGPRRRRKHALYPLPPRPAAPQARLLCSAGGASRRPRAHQGSRRYTWNAMSRMPPASNSSIQPGGLSSAMKKPLPPG